MRKLFILMLLLCLCKAGVGQSVSDILAELPPVTQADRLQYWYDDDIGTLRSTQQLNGMHTFDVSALLDGLHTLHVQIVDNTDVICSSCSQVFLKLTSQASTSPAKQLQYWFDDSETITTAPLSSGVQLLDVNSLLDGLHTLHYQVVDENWRVSTPCSQIFLKLTSQASTSPAKQLQYWFDDSEAITTAPLSSGVQLLDVNSLLDGLHTLHFQVVDEYRRVTTPCSQVFLKLTDVHATGQPTHLRYWFDDDDTTLRESTTVSGLQMLDVSELVTGLHTVHVMLADENGRTTVPYSAVFFKMYPDGVSFDHNVLTHYVYWVNDETTKTVKVDISKPVSNYQLVTLLPIAEIPIRTSSFLFKVEENTPVIYSQNELYFRFYDAMGYNSDGMRSFTDYRVKEEVTDITPLLPTQTFARPDENTIKWFSFEAFKGDTIAFRSSQATSLQVFSPTGQEIYVASGDKSVKYGGCHTWEDGTYYLAVHDVTGSQANIKLDFMHCERYAIVSQDVYKVGNGGYSTVTFQGNGFQELVSVELDDNAGHVIPGEIQSKESKIQTVVRFDFANSPTGIYKATFRFEDGVRTVNNCLTVETAKAITINEQVKYAVQYLKSRTNDYIINLTNEGNSTAYDVPIVIGVFTPQMEDLNKVKIDGCDLYKLRKNNMPELFTPDFETDFKSRLFSEGVKSLFLKVDSVDYVEGHPAMHRATLTVNLRPSTTETLKVSINAKSTAYVYVWYPYQWGSQSSEVPQNINLTKTVVDDARCGFATRKQQMCEENEMLIAYGEEPIYDVKDCPPKAPNRICPPPPGGGSTPVASLDPNDIYGYTSASGSRFMSDSIQNVNYRIEFENDTTFATASAHMVEVKDTLDARYFDLASYAPTGFKIGDKTEYLEGTPQFVKTVDMRPQINAIVQVEGLYDKQKGIATWRFTSLDPMTMEPTDDVMQGFLPVNYDGESGIGEVTFDVALRQKFTDGTEIPNKASIVFDSNEPIMTPVWINTVDAVCPESRVLDVTQKNDTTLTISYEGRDSRSGVWKYEVYAQYGSGNTPWEKVAETAADSCNIDFRFYKSIDYGFCVLAVDSAGNVEQKPLAREGSFADVDMGDVNGDGEVNTLDASLTTAYYLGKQAYIIATAADVNGDGVIDTLDATQITQMFLDAQVIAPETNALPRRRVKPKQTLQP